MHQFVQKIWERNDKLPLDYQIFNEICILLFIFSLCGFAQSFFIHQPLFISILFLITSALGILLIWLSNFKNYFKASKLIFTLILYSFSILGWFYNSGINGASVLVFLGLNIYILGFHNKNFIPLLSLNIIIYTFLAVFSYLRPQAIQFSYLTEGNHVFDMVSSYIIISVSIVLVLKTIMKNFNRSKEVIIAQKITQELMNNDLKRSKEIVEERESYLNSLINNRDQGIWTIDRNYNFNIYNTIYKDNYLKTFNNELYKGLNSLSYLTPELFDFWKSKYDKALAGKQIVFDYLNKEGHKKEFYQVSLNPIFLDGEIIGVSGLAVNITEHHNTENALKESKEKLKAILKTIPDYIFHFNKKGVFIDFYQENKDSKLISNPKEFIHKSISEIFEKELALTIQEKISETLETGSSEMEYSIQMDELKYFEAKFSFLNKNEVIASIRDITDRKKVHQELKELNTSKDKLFSIIAHDLRSPFNNILGFSELLVKNGDNYDADKNKQYLSIINSSAKNTLDLLDNLLNWAKSQSGRIVYSPQKINLSTAIDEMISNFKTTAKFKHIALNYIKTNEIEIHTDIDLLKTVLRNLISNAIKFTKQDGTITVSVIEQQQHVEISVADNGVGINEENRKKLFKTSTYNSSRGTANEKGSGLGLVLCKEFIEKIGGKIWVKSEVGKGSLFKFTLPQVKT